eukprot:6333814-Lingulodinium_polyedra.AAC.1
MGEHGLWLNNLEESQAKAPLPKFGPPVEEQVQRGHCLAWGHQDLLLIEDHHPKELPGPSWQWGQVEEGPAR